LDKTDRQIKDREKILIYSAQKFHKEGFYKTSMDEIAKELCVSKKTIYKHFPSKENLLEEICSHTTNEIYNNVDIIVDGDGNVVFKFVKLLNMYSNYTLNISDKWLHDLKIHHPEILKTINHNRTFKINGILNKLITQGIKEKLIENYPPQIIISAFIHSISGVMNPEFLINNKFTMQIAFKTTYEMLLNGILTGSGKKIFKKEKSLLAKEIKL